LISSFQEEAMHDLIIRGGTIVDGTGCATREADVAVDNGRITEIGRIAMGGREEINAKGKIVTPGFVDIHTHYDGQATWDPEMAPSAWHGVTTVVMGNCGVGFAPAKPDKHDWLIGLMEGVEDIPGTALNEGMSWGWETFPEYMDVLEKMRRSIDIGCQVPHGAVRAYVMGERGARNEPATDVDIAQMAAIVEEGIHAGALGFSTSRTILHRAIDGEVVPGTWADKRELLALGRALKRAGQGVFEMASDLNPEGDEFGWMSEMSRDSGLPVTFALLQSMAKQMNWRDQLSATEKANANGANVRAQIALRGTGVLMCWQGSVHPFVTRPAWKAIKDQPWDMQLQALRDPSFKAKLLSDPIDRPDIDVGPLFDVVTQGWSMHFVLGDNPDYEPGAEKSIASLAKAAGRDPAEYTYELLMQNNGQGIIYLPILNYSDGNLDFVRELLLNDHTVVSLSDGGAHCGTICDAASPTFMLSYWARDRKRGTIPLELAVKRQTHDTAALYGMGDRGVIAPGKLADLNVIDFSKLSLERPYVAFDLPAGGRRLLQKSSGFDATIKNGQVTWREGVATGIRPGGLVRGVRVE
jgi:N-acyl-D-amino-acid deacylase